MSVNRKKLRFFLVYCFLVILSSFLQAKTMSGKYQSELNDLPLYFIPNQGQVHSQVQYYAKTSRYTLWITKKGLIFGNKEKSSLTFKGAKKNPEILPLKKTSHRINVIKGVDKSKWLTNIPTSEAVLYKTLYPKIDLKIYGKEPGIEYDWIIKPGGKVSDIQFIFDHVKKTVLDMEGNLLVLTEQSEISHLKPVCYQVIKGKKVKINAAYCRLQDHEFGFSVEEYDKNFDLVIDPYVMVYSSYVGGSGTEEMEDIAVDKKGALYVCGRTNSTDFPTKKAVQDIYNGGYDAFVYKIKPNGKGLVYSTYLGGSDNDMAFGICVDNKGAAYITGLTDSSDFPTQNAFDDEFGEKRDAFIVKIKPLGNLLEYSTFLGGFGEDQGLDIALDKKGSVYVTGATASYDFPTKNAIQSQLIKFKDIFVTKLKKNGKTLVYSTYLGGSHDDYGSQIAVDKTGAVLVAGGTFSSDFPTKKALQPQLAGMIDSIVFKIKPAGNSLVYSTFFGGAYQDHLRGLAVDKNGRVWLTGYTYSDDFPTSNPFQASLRGDMDIFVSQINQAGKALLFSTYLGGKKVDYSLAIALDQADNAWITGYTSSSNFPVRSPLQKKPKKLSDAIISVFSSSNYDLIFSTYLGGSKGEGGYGIAVDNKDSVYIAGLTSSRNFPRLKAFQKKYGGGPLDCFVTKIKKIK